MELTPARTSWVSTNSCANNSTYVAIQYCVCSSQSTLRQRGNYDPSYRHNMYRLGWWWNDEFVSFVRSFIYRDNSCCCRDSVGVGWTLRGRELARQLARAADALRRPAALLVVAALLAPALPLAGSVPSYNSFIVIITVISVEGCPLLDISSGFAKTDRSYAIPVRHMPATLHPLITPCKCLRRLCNEFCVCSWSFEKELEQAFSHLKVSIGVEVENFN